MTGLIKTPDGDWIQPEAVGAVRYTFIEDDKDADGGDWMVAIYSLSGEIFWTQCAEDDEEAKEIVDKIAALINKKLDPMAAAPKN